MSGMHLLAGVLAPRWQLVPAAVGLAVLVLVGILALTTDGVGSTIARGSSALAVVGVLLSALLAWLLPLPALTLEDGSPPVGSVAFDLVDEDRTGPSARADGPRRLPVQVWYPTTVTDGPRLRITDEPRPFAEAVSSFLGLPAFVLTHLDEITTAAVVDAPPVDGRLPVVLSIHGWGGFRFAQAPLLEQLAADGHLVIAMDHTHGALAAQPAAGGVVPLDPDLLPDGVPQAVYDEAAMVLERTFADDAAALLAALRSGDAQVPDEVLAAADLDQLVVLGHSTGGGAAALLCSEQPCDAMVLYDPWVEPVPADVRADGFAAPTLVLLSEAWVDNDNDGVLRPMVDASDDVTFFVVEGTTHNDVTVQPRLSPLSPQLGIAGEVAVDRVHEIVTATTRSWIARTTGTGVGDPDLVDDPPFGELRRR